jgi:hypothetical protein
MRHLEGATLPLLREFTTESTKSTKKGGEFGV